MGVCINRRYQIWIENKLLAKSNREKFLYDLIFLNTIPNDWKVQTQIGLIKSRYSKPFFIEYGKDLIKNNLLLDFIRLTNLYGFEINSSANSKCMLDLKPSGVGRACLIHLIASEKWYIDNYVPEEIKEQYKMNYDNMPVDVTIWKKLYNMSIKK